MVFILCFFGWFCYIIWFWYLKMTNHMYPTKFGCWFSLLYLPWILLVFTKSTYIHIYIHANMFLICYHVICQLHKDILHFALSHLMWLRWWFGHRCCCHCRLYDLCELLFFPSLESVMGNIRGPFKGIITDIKGRSACYKQDWVNGLCSGFRYVICFNIFGTTFMLLWWRNFHVDSYINFFYFY